MINETDMGACRCLERATEGDCVLRMRVAHSLFLSRKQEAGAPFDIDLFFFPIIPFFMPVRLLFRDPIINLVYTVPLSTRRPLLPPRMRFRPSMIATKRANILHALLNRHPPLHKHRPAHPAMPAPRPRLVRHALDVPVRGRRLDRSQLRPHDRASGLPVRPEGVGVVGVAEVGEEGGRARVVDVDVVFVAPV